MDHGVNIKNTTVFKILLDLRMADGHVKRNQTDILPEEPEIEKITYFQMS